MADLASASIIDADGHVLEPAWLWEEYLEAEFRDRAIRIVPDDQGLEVVLVDGTRVRSALARWDRVDRQYG